MRFLFTVIIFFLASANGHSQIKTGTYFLGVNPSITVEPYYPKGDFDINILPLVVQKIITRRSGIRIISLLNLGFRSAGNRISHIGLSGGWVYYLSQQDEILNSKDGLYVAPVIEVSNNRIEHSVNTGLYAETGYQFLLPKNLGITTALQLGYTHFNYSNTIIDTWKPHFGIKVIFGKWIQKK